MSLGCDNDPTCAARAQSATQDAAPSAERAADSPTLCTQSAQHAPRNTEVSHAHDHSASAFRAHDRKALQIAMAITGGVFFAEIVGAWLSGSLALLADSGHMFTDLGGLVLAFVASRISEAPSTRAKTYGYLRTEILAALANGIVLVGLAGSIAYLAVRRLQSPAPVLGGVMLAVAVVGLIANLLCARVLYRGSKQNLNLRAAFLHVASDALGSLGAILAACGVFLFGWTWIDPLVALLIAVLILVSAWRVVQESVDVLMESTPKHVDLDRLREEILATDGVLAVHDLHVWTLTSGYCALSAHVDVYEGRETLPILRALVALAQERYAIAHTTFQLEVRTDAAACGAEASR